MSLLSSIFGDKKESEGSDLFNKSSSLPERPQHKPLAPIKRDNKRKPEGVEETNNEEPTEDVSSKNRKKQKRKQKHVDERDNKETPTEDNDKDPKKVRKSRKPNEEDDKEKDDGSSSSDSNGSDDGDESTDGKEDATTKKDGASTEKKIEEIEEKEDSNINDKDAEERTIFVGNLPLATTTRRSLAKLFKDCGPIESTRIRSVPVKGVKIPADRKGDQNLVKKICANTKQYDETLASTVLGYVVFKNKESVPKALEKNHTTVDKILLKVDTASPTLEPSRSVFCGNLPYSTDEASLMEHFVKGCALSSDDVLSARIVRDKETFQCKGFGYVLFKEKDMVSAALKLHNSMYKKKQMRVLVCGKRFKKKKVQDPTNNNARHQQQQPEKLSAGALRRILSKQQNEAETINKRKRGDKKRPSPAMASNKAKAQQAQNAGLSRRAVAEKKVDKRVKKIQRRISKGMGKKKSR